MLSSKTKSGTEVPNFVIAGLVPVLRVPLVPGSQEAVALGQPTYFRLLDFHGWSPYIVQSKSAYTIYGNLSTVWSFEGDNFIGISRLGSSFPLSDPGEGEMELLDTLEKHGYHVIEPSYRIFIPFQLLFDPPLHTSQAFPARLGIALNEVLEDFILGLVEFHRIVFELHKTFVY